MRTTSGTPRLNRINWTMNVTATSSRKHLGTVDPRRAADFGPPRLHDEAHRFQDKGLGGPLRLAHVAAGKPKPLGRSALLETDPVHGRSLLSLIHAPLLVKTSSASAGVPVFLSCAIAKLIFVQNSDLCSWCALFSK